MNWILKKPNLNVTKSIMDSYDVPKVVAIIMNIYELSDQLYLKRFMSPSINNFHNPFFMKGMNKAIKRIFNTIESGQKVFILCSKTRVLLQKHVFSLREIYFLTKNFIFM